MLRRLGFAITFCAGQVLAQDAAITLSSDLPSFGGLSAIEMAADGGTAWLLSDRGSAFVVTLHRDKGVLTRAEVAPWPEAVIAGDVEGLAIGDSLSAYSTESAAGVRLINGSALPSHPDFAQLPANAALEALAIAPNGALWTIPEEARDGVFPTYKLDGNTWRRGPDIPADDNFRPTGADFGPDGALYILERKLTIFGFEARVRRLRIEKRTVDTVLTLNPTPHGNFEGIATWKDTDGATRVVLVADNNFRMIIENVLAEFLLPES